MDNTYWVLAITIFLSFLSLVKYTNKEQLRDWIEDYVDRVLPREVEEEEIIEIEEIQDIIFDFVIRNQTIFSKIKVKDGEQSRSCETSEGDSKES
jgi:hypothetical protein